MISNNINTIENIQIREILSQDIFTLAKLEAENFSDSWSKEALIDSFSQNYVHFYGAYKGKKLVGYLIFSHIVDEVEIFRIAVARSCRREGIGQILLDAMLDFGKEKKVTRALLDVRQSNAPAIFLYKKIGFKEDGRRRNFYESPREDAILMSMNILEDI